LLISPSAYIYMIPLHHDHHASISHRRLKNWITMSALLTMISHGLFITGSLTAFIVPPVGSSARCTPAKRPTRDHDGAHLGGHLRRPAPAGILRHAKKSRRIFTRSQPGIPRIRAGGMEEPPSFLFCLAGYSSSPGRPLMSSRCSCCTLPEIPHEHGRAKRYDPGTIFVTALVVLPLWNWISKRPISARLTSLG